MPHWSSLALKVTSHLAVSTIRLTETRLHSNCLISSEWPIDTLHRAPFSSRHSPSAVPLPSGQRTALAV